MTYYDSIFVNFSYLLTILTVVLHIFCAIGVSKDLANLNKRSKKVELLPPAGWILASLISGIFGIAIYWFIHHLNFNNR